MSPSSFEAAHRAQLAPTLPPPMIAILGRLSMVFILLVEVFGLFGRHDRGAMRARHPGIGVNFRGDWFLGVSDERDRFFTRIE